MKGLKPLIDSRRRSCLPLLTLHTWQLQAGVPPPRQKRFGSDSTVVQTGSLRSHDEVVNHFLETYAKNSRLSATESAIPSLGQRPNQDSIAFKYIIFTKTWRCGNFIHRALASTFLTRPAPRCSIPRTPLTFRAP